MKWQWGQSAATLLLLGAAYLYRFKGVRLKHFVQFRNQQTNNFIQFKGHINILSYNLWGSYFMGGPHFKDRLEVFAGQAGSYDVLLLQEMFVLSIGPFVVPNSVDWFVWRMQQEGFVYTTNPITSCPSWFGQNNGLLILSKLPIKEISNVSFGEKNRRKLSFKGWLEVELMLNDESPPLKLVTTHLEHANEDLKVRQLHEVFESALKHDPKRTIICGDFNTGPNIPEIRTSYESFTSLISKYDLVDLFPGPEKTYRDEVKKTGKTKVKNPSFAIDHMLLTNDLVEGVVVDSAQIVEHKELRDGELLYASDHKAIHFTLDTTNLVCDSNGVGECINPGML